MRANAASILGPPTSLSRSQFSCTSDHATRFDRSKNLLDQVYPKALERQNNLVLCFAHVIRPIIALRNEWNNWDMCFNEAETLIEDTGLSISTLQSTSTEQETSRSRRSRTRARLAWKRWNNGRVWSAKIGSKRHSLNYQNDRTERLLSGFRKRFIEFG